MNDKPFEQIKPGDARSEGLEAVSMNAIGPIMRFQVSVLRWWSDTFAKIAQNQERKLAEISGGGEERQDGR